MITAKEAMQRYSNPLFNPWVIGGKDARMHAYPWVVQLKRPNAPTPGCGGGIINSRIEFLNFEINTFGKMTAFLLQYNYLLTTLSFSLMISSYYKTSFILLMRCWNKLSPPFGTLETICLIACEYRSCGSCRKETCLKKHCKSVMLELRNSTAYSLNEEQEVIFILKVHRCWTCLKVW